MALKATIFKATLAVADMERHHYASYALTLARHPSETDQRMMVRMLAFALHADAALAFGRGLSSEDEPDIALRDDTGAILLWIDVGLPDEKLLRRAAGRARDVVVYAYGGRAVDLWWERNSGVLARLSNLTVRAVAPETVQALGALAARSMQLQCAIQEGHIWFSDNDTTVAVELRELFAPMRNTP
ncbi:MAG: YaeQ family protein [Betaproteobacteria bacterium]